MTDQEREVMQQRLEALETAHDDSLDGQEFSCRQILMEQISALREALAAPAQSVRPGFTRGIDGILRADPMAAPQPAQKEPANLCPYTEDEDGKRDAWIEGWESAQTAALTALQPAQDPVGYISKTGHGTYFRETLTDELKSLEWADEKMWKAVFYVAPQPQSQPLTDEQIDVASPANAEHAHYFFEGARFAEAAHGIGDKK